MSQSYRNNSNSNMMIENRDYYEQRHTSSNNMMTMSSATTPETTQEQNNVQEEEKEADDIVELLEADTGIPGVDLGDVIDERSSFIEKAPDSSEMLFEDVVGPVDVD